MQRATADLLRVIAMLAVVVIHGGGQATAAWGPGAGLAATLAAVCDQAARFCVPIFVLLSGQALAARAAARGPEGWRVFLAPRLARILPPLLAFSGLFVLVQCLRYPSQALGFLAAWPRALLSGGDYHLYFLPIILACYLAFLPLRRLGPGRAVLVLAPLYLLCCIPFDSIAPWLHRGLAGEIPWRWLAWFALGMWLAGRPSPGPVGVPRRLAATLVLAAAIAWTAAECLHAVAGGWAIADIQHYSRLSVTVLALAVWWWFCEHDAVLAAALAPPARAAVLTRAAAWSFAVFLLHPWVLRPLQATPLPAWPQVQVLTVLAITTALVALADRRLRPAWLRLAMGLELKR